MSETPTPPPVPPEDEPWEQRRARVYASHVAAEIAEHGEVRPPWIAFPAPEYHPRSIGWRMGGGEDHLTTWRLWAADRFDRWDEAERIAYFRRWGVQPRWLEWVMLAIWGEPAEPSFRRWEPEDWGNRPEMARAEAAGLGDRHEFARDFHDTGA